MNTNSYTPSGAVIYTPERTKALLARRGTSPRTAVVPTAA
ncbi:hypothetical protein CLV35_2737 [Motilibacter peucedani]|uniref:Uncharacterized protein n=1 Tax=Motilibacter peucedani TaxID=598650 RepID=A0A420XMI9_9ACTN|nr:hypothetical protein CLV35_2737 [Motilibacter peucedani]